MKEIGSEFWDVLTIEKRNSLFPESAQWFLSGRNALQAIVRELNHCHTVAMPSWCCDSMVKPFTDAGIEVHFYPVYWEDGLVQEVSLDSDILFLMEYFGYRGQTTEFHDYKGIVIRDVTHSLFSITYSDADYCFGSLRKWCGVWTGGYAWTRDGHKLNMKNSDDFEYIFLRKKAMQLKNSYLHEWGVTDKEYLKIYEIAEDILEKLDTAPAADRDIWVAQRLDVELIKSRRRTNATILRKIFCDWLMFPEMRDSDCPMFVPVIVPDGRRDALRRFLIKNDIYCPVHWPVSEYHKLDEKTELVYKNELSLVCDQRYTEEDMNRMVYTIKLFMGGN